MLAQVVREIIEEKKKPQFIGFSFLIAGMVANAAVTAQVMKMVNTEADFSIIFTSSFLGQFSFISVNLLAPFLEPISSRIRKFTFAFSQSTISNARPGSLEAQANLLNATYTFREQQASDHILTFRNALRFNFESAMRAIETGDEQTVVVELADALMAGYRHFREISPSDPTIINAVRSTFLRKIRHPEALQAAVLKQIRNSVVPENLNSIEAQKYYEQAVAAWLASSQVW
jgi:hypothetical protein